MFCFTRKTVSIYEQDSVNIFPHVFYASLLVIQIFEYSPFLYQSRCISKPPLTKVESFLMSVFDPNQI